MATLRGQSSELPTMALGVSWSQLAGRALRQVAGGVCLPGAADTLLLGPRPQVLMRLGRQRWKLKGRIESDDSQTWDEEEKAFIPTLHENFEIKVGGA